MCIRSLTLDPQIKIEMIDLASGTVGTVVTPLTRNQNFSIENQHQSGNKK